MKTEHEIRKALEFLQAHYAWTYPAESHSNVEFTKGEMHFAEWVLGEE